MAVIKSSNSTDAAVVDPQSKALRVTLYNSEGTPGAVNIDADSDTLSQEATNQRIFDQIATQTTLLSLLLAEMRVQTALLAGLANAGDNIETMRADEIANLPDAM